jgi:hypothetical protein
MAEADSKSTTLDDEWPLLSVVLAFVAQLCKSEPAAKALILEFARKGHFTQYRFVTDDDPSARGIPPTSWGAGAPKIGLYVPVDFETNTVTYARGEPASTAFTLELEDRLEGFLPPPFYQIRLVRLHRDEVMSMLFAVGLLTVRGALAATETGDTAAGTGHLEAVSADVAEGKPKPPKSKWVRAYLTDLTEDGKKELKRKYPTVGEASTAINQIMKDIPGVGAYTNPRVLEPFLEDLYPSKKRKH